MKTISTIILAIFFACNLATAQDTMYVYRAGTVISKQAVADVDSVIFYKPITPPAVVTDIDGNVYHSVTIGTQTWMVENLKTTKYNDGTSIPLVSDGTAWTNLTTPGYCWYNNDDANKNVYGALYNWYAVNTGKLAPLGWHVPTDAEWTMLCTYLGGESVAGGKLKEAGTLHWLSPNTSATNETGFTALPGGYRVYEGSFFGFGSKTHWWSSTQYITDWAWDRYLGYGISNVGRHSDEEQYGFFVRLLHD